MQVLFIKIIKILLFLTIELLASLWYNILVIFCPIRRNLCTNL